MSLFEPGLYLQLLRLPFSFPSFLLSGDVDAKILKLRRRRRLLTILGFCSNTFSGVVESLLELIIAYRAGESEMRFLGELKRSVEFRQRFILCSEFPLLDRFNQLIYFLPLVGLSVSQLHQA